MRTKMQRMQHSLCAVNNDCTGKDMHGVMMLTDVVGCIN